MFTQIRALWDSQTRNAIDDADLTLRYALDRHNFLKTKLIDDLDGRFESLAAHASVPFSLNAYFLTKRASYAFMTEIKKMIADGLREEGVSDMRIDKQLRQRLEDLYGRVESYRKFLANADLEGLKTVCARNGFSSKDPSDGSGLARSMFELKTIFENKLCIERPNKD